MNRTEVRAASSLAGVYVLRMLGLFMVMPVIALLAKDFDDYSPLYVGLAIGGYGLTQALLQIPMGMLSDKLGRKPVIVFGLTLFAIGSGVAALADSLLWIVIGRLLQGTGAIAGAIMALAGDVSRDSERSKVMAVIGIAIGFSFYLSLLLGPLIANTFGLQGIFAITALLALCCIPLVGWVVPAATNFAPSGDTLPVKEDIRRLLRDPQLVRLNLSVCALHMLITLLFVQLPSLLVAHHVYLDSHWLVYLPVLVVSVIGMALVMRYSKGERTIAAIKFSIALLICSLVLLAGYASHFGILIVASVIFFTGFNFLEANFPALVSAIAPAGKKGSAMGIYASFQFLGAFLGGALAGVISQYFSVETLFLSVALLCVFWFFSISGLRGIYAAKRYTLAYNDSEISVQHISSQLAALKGVKDITIVPEQGVAYLKVDGHQFDVRLARKIAGIQG